MGLKKRHPLRAVLIIIVCIVLLAVVAANALLDYALNPNAPLSIKTVMEKGVASGAFDLGALRLDSAYEDESQTWFANAKESTSVTAEDGTELLGWKVDCNTASASETSVGLTQVSHNYAVFCHGYTNEPAGMAKYAYHFYNRGYNVMLPAARGHERNMATGYIQMGWQDSKDLVYWINQIVEQDPQARIVLMGVSMGGAEVMMASGWDLPSNVACIVEDCGYSGVWDEFVLQMDNMFHLPSFPLLNLASFFCKVRAGYSFEEASATAQLAKATTPILFIHGDSDDFVPYSDLQTNYDACASSDKQMLTVEGAGHGMSASIDPDLYWSTVDAFVDARV